MAHSFETLARAGVIDTARGFLRSRLGFGPYPGTGPIFKQLIERIKRIGAATDDVSYEVARSVARRAIASLNAAAKLNAKSKALPVPQHGYDPSFAGDDVGRFVYRTIIVCRDEDTGQEVHVPVDVDSDTPLDGDKIREEALDAYSRGQTTFRGGKSKYPTEGSCVLVTIHIIFAIRTR